MGLEVIDDFLPPEEFKKIESRLYSTDIAWYYNPNAVTTDPKTISQFTHTFFDIRRNGQVSDFFHLFTPCLHKLRAVTLYRLKANLNLKTFFHRPTGYHIDIPHPDLKTSVFYINTNNGFTQFKRGGKIRSIANRMVIFDSEMEHQGVTCTDEKNRVVVNFNYGHH